MANIDACLSTGKDDWETPDDLFDRYNQQFHFVLDAAASAVNRKCPRYFGPGGEREDALVGDWPLEEGNIWLNPPYSRGLQARFVRKAFEQAQRADHISPVHYVVCLLPARTDTKLFHEIIYPHADKIEFLKGRVKFKGAPAGAPFPSMVVTF